MLWYAGGYLTNEGKLDVNRLEAVFAALAKYEDEVFENRLNEEARERSRHNRRGRKNQEWVEDEEDSADEDALEAAAHDADQKQWADAQHLARSGWGGSTSTAVATTAQAPAPAKETDEKQVAPQVLEANSYHPLSKGDALTCLQSRFERWRWHRTHSLLVAVVVNGAGRR